MAAQFPITPPSGNPIQWVVQNPEQVAALVHLANALAAMEITVKFNGKVIRCPIIVTGENAQIQINLS